jgi:cell division transport system permease protein
MRFFALRGFALGSALRLIGRGWGVFLLSALLGALALTLPAAVGLLALQLAPLAERAQLAPEATVFLTLTATGAQTQALQQRLERSPGVASVRLLARDAALAELLQRAGENAPRPALNPLPDVLIVRFAGGSAAQTVEESIAGFRTLPQVDLVQADTGWYRKLMALNRTGALLGAMLGGLGLALLALVLVGAVRLLAVASAAEVRTLRLLGATERLIRRPVVYAGTAAMLLAALLAAGLLWALTAVIEPQLAELAREYGIDLKWQAPPATWLASGLAALLLAAWMLASLAARAAIRSAR